MTLHAAATETAERPRTLVWIDSRVAILARWDGTEASLSRIESDVPVRHRSTGHVTHGHAGGPPGGMAPQTDGEARRLEHLARYLRDVADHIPEHDEVQVLGPGTVHERLAALLREDDAAHHRERVITATSAAPLTDPQLIARLRRAAGVSPRRGRRTRQPARSGRRGRPILAFPEEEFGEEGA